MLKIKQNTTDNTVLSPSYCSTSLHHDSAKDSDPTSAVIASSVSSRGDVKSEHKNKNHVSCTSISTSNSQNPFAIKERSSTPAANDVIVEEQGLSLKRKPERGGHKLLSLKVRKRKHRTLSVTPPQSGHGSGGNSKKVCRTAEDENVQPDSTVLDCPADCIDLGGSEKPKDGSTIKICDTRKISFPFSTEEENLMGSYAIDVDNSNARILSLADLDVKGHLSSTNSPVKKQTSNAHHKSIPNRLSTSVLTIPCSPSFSPRKPTPTAFSPFLERMGQSSRTCSSQRDSVFVNGHVKTSESREKLDSSALLFSTPTDSSAVIPPAPPLPRSASKPTSRRTLVFGSPNKTADHVSLVQQVNETLLPSTNDPPPLSCDRSTTSGNDFSFVDDISLSEFANISHTEMEADSSSLMAPSEKRSNLNRHLVLEVTSQECSGEDALLCTGRYVCTLICVQIDITQLL